MPVSYLARAESAKSLPRAMILPSRPNRRWRPKCVWGIRGIGGRSLGGLGLNDPPTAVAPSIAFESSAPYNRIGSTASVQSCSSP
jgi:hypothetical protein